MEYLQYDQSAAMDFRKRHTFGKVRLHVPYRLVRAIGYGILPQSTTMGVARTCGHTQPRGYCLYQRRTFWDMDRHEMYSNMFMTIRKPDEFLQGYNFRSNEQMTRYSVSNANAETPFSDSGSSSSNDSVMRAAPTKPNQP